MLLVLPYPNRRRALLQPLRAYAGTELQRFTRSTGLLRLLGPQLEAMEALLPPLSPEGFADRFPLLNPAHGERRGRVGLVLGCRVMLAIALYPVADLTLVMAGMGGTTQLQPKL